MEKMKDQLKAANESELVTLVKGVTDQIRNGRYRKVEVRRDVVAILSQRRPRVNAVTREAYQTFIYFVCSAASKNQDVMQRVRKFAQSNGLEWK